MNTSIYQIIHRYWEKVNSYQKRHGFFKPQLIFQRCNEKLNDTNKRLTQTALNYLKAKVNDIKSVNDKIKLLYNDDGSTNILNIISNSTFGRLQN